MTLKTLKPKANNLLILDDEFLQYCELNNIEDVQKLARETFKQGFDLLKYGTIPANRLIPSDKNEQKPVRSEHIEKEVVVVKETKSDPIVFSHPNSILPMEEIKKEIKGKIDKIVEKNNLYDE
jgi:hypothetical protein